MLPQNLYPLFLKSRSVTIDSRKIKKGDIFFALKGERTDGNQFAVQAIQNGAIAAVVDDPLLKETPGCIYVRDTLVGLQSLARFHRAQITIPVIGLTGSNGKTTTKKLIHHLLSSKYQAYCTPGNYNNHIGVPLSVLSIPEHTEIAVIEMGANHQKEIAFLSEICQPTHGLITNIGKAHLEGFGGIEGVKIGKGELYDYLASHNGVVFYNEEEQFLPEMAQKIPKRVPYSSKGFVTPFNENIQFANLKFEPSISFDLYHSGTHQRQPIEATLFGPYNFANIVSAITVASYFDVNLKAIGLALRSFQPESNRSEQVLWRDNTVLMDAYNANPNSMKSAIDSFVKMKSRQKQMMIIGEMYELGEYSEMEHREIVKMCKAHSGIEVIFIGEGYKKFVEEYQLNWFPNATALRLEWQAHPPSDRYLLLKGSRGVALENILF